MSGRTTMACIVDRQGVTVTSGSIAARFSHELIDAAPVNPDREGGLVIRDGQGREWILDAVWMGDYRRARAIAQATAEDKLVT